MTLFKLTAAQVGQVNEVKNESATPSEYKQENMTAGVPGRAVRLAPLAALTWSLALILIYHPDCL